MKRLAALILVFAMAAAALCSCGQSGVNVAGLKTSDYIELGDYENFTVDDLKNAYRLEQERVAASYTQFNVDWGYTVEFNLVCEIVDTADSTTYTKYEPYCFENETCTINIYEDTDDAYRASFDSAFVYNLTKATDPSSGRSVRTITIGKAFDFLFDMPYIADNAELSGKTVRFTVTPVKVLPPLYDYTEIEDSLAAFYEKHTFNRDTVEKGDIIVADIRGYVDDELYDGCIYDDLGITVGCSPYFSGFDDELIGMKSNSRKTFVLTFPEDYHDETLAGKMVQFTVKIKSVISYNKAASENSDCKTLCELQQAFRLELFARENITSIVYSRTNLKNVPEELYQEYLGFFEKNYESRISEAMKSGATRDEVIETGWGSDAAYRKYLDDMTKQAVKETLASYALLDKLGVKFTSATYKETLKDYTAWYNAANGTSYTEKEIEGISNVNLLKVRFIEGIVSEEICSKIKWLPLIDIAKE